MYNNNFANDFWNQRFSGDEFIYGTEPNSFFKEQIIKLSPGKILLPGEGEGRNAVYAAKLGWSVDSVDFSSTAKLKAERLAEQNNVKINYHVEKLEMFSAAELSYDAVGIIFVHLDEKIRSEVHNKFYNSLKPGGIIIMEVFSKSQFGKTSGGPQDINMLYSEEDIRNSFPSIKFEYLAELKVNLSEGNFHSGEASVIRFIGKKI